MLKMDEEADDCHQGLEFHEAPVWRTEAAQDHHTINFSFSCDPVYIYTGHSEFFDFDYEVETAVERSIRVELRDLNDWEEARERLEGLFRDFPMCYQMRCELTSAAVEIAKGILLSSSGCGHRVLHLHIPFDVVHEHISNDDEDDLNCV